MKIYDVIVIGGGPAGTMAAGRAAQRGRSVLLLEKNETLGRKLLITGGGRCNLTNLKTDNRTLLEKYKNGTQFLFSSFAQFNVKDALEFFNSRGLATKEENEGRVFPVSNKAQSVLDVLEKFMQEGGVTIKTSTEVKKIEVKNNIFVITTKHGEEFSAESCVLATGGTSYPATGSTGEGLKWLTGLGHTIVENIVALTPVTLSDNWAKKISGLTLKDVKLTIFQNSKKQKSVSGDLLFTHFGVSGPAIINSSKYVGELLKSGKVIINLDLFPKLDLAQLKIQLQNLLANNNNKKIKNTLSELVPSALALALLQLAKIDGELKNHNVPAEARRKLLALIKAVPLNVSGLLEAKAIASYNGVELKEVNFKTMESRLIPHLYLVGDVLNIDRPSGGYSLQLCWTTGFVAGSHS